MLLWECAAVVTGSLPVGSPRNSTASASAAPAFGAAEAQREKRESGGRANAITPRVFAAPTEGAASTGAEGGDVAAALLSSADRGAGGDEGGAGGGAGASTGGGGRGDGGTMADAGGDGMLATSMALLSLVAASLLGGSCLRGKPCEPCRAQGASSTSVVAGASDSGAMASSSAIRDTLLSQRSCTGERRPATGEILEAGDSAATLSCATRARCGVDGAEGGKSPFQHDMASITVESSGEQLGADGTCALAASSCGAAAFELSCLSRESK